MSRAWLIFGCMFVLGACSNNPSQKATLDLARNGEQAYLELCAGCHETGMLGAPIAGDANYWQGRSELWQAVLMEHAKHGYYDMPAKGGRTDIPDELVDAATEYMLSITFPDLPQDQ